MCQSDASRGAERPSDAGVQLLETDSVEAEYSQGIEKGRAAAAKKPTATRRGARDDDEVRPISTSWRARPQSFLADPSSVNAAAFPLSAHFGPRWLDAQHIDGKRHRWTEGRTVFEGRLGPPGDGCIRPFSRPGSDLCTKPKFGVLCRPCCSSAIDFITLFIWCCRRMRKGGG